MIDIDCLRRTIVVPRVLYASDAFHVKDRFERDRNELLKLYVTPIVRLTLLDNVLPYSPLRIGYKEAIDTITDYCQNKGFVKIQDDDGESIPDNFFDLHLCNLQAITSFDVKGAKFILGVLRKYYRKFLPAVSEKDLELGAELGESSCVMRVSDTSASLSSINAPLYSLNLSDVPENDLQRLSNGLHYIKVANIYDAALLVLIYGREIKPKVEQLYKVAVTEEDLKRAISLVDTYFRVIPFCAEEFRKDLLASVFAKHKKDEKRLINEVWGLCKGVDNIRQIMKHRSEEAQDAEEAAQSHIVDLERQLESAKRMAAQDEALPQKYSEATARIDSLSGQVEEKRAQVQDLKAQVATLTRQLEAAHANNIELNNQLIDAYEENGVFYEDDDDTPAEQKLSGLKERLGDEAIEKLAEKKVIVVGGHINTHVTLRELFPDWEYMSKCKSLRKSTQYKADVMLIMTSYCAHSTYISARGLQKSSGIPVCLCPRNSPLGVCETLQKFFAEYD